MKRQRKERLELFPKLRAAESHAKVTILSFSAMHTQSMSINLSKPTPNAMKYFLVVVNHKPTAVESIDQRNSRFSRTSIII